MSPYENVRLPFLINLYLFYMDYFFFISPNRLMTKSTEFTSKDEHIPISKFPFKTFINNFHWIPMGDSVLILDVT